MKSPLLRGMKSQDSQCLEVGRVMLDSSMAPFAGEGLRYNFAVPGQRATCVHGRSSLLAHYFCKTLLMKV